MNRSTCHSAIGKFWRFSTTSTENLPAPSSVTRDSVHAPTREAAALASSNRWISSLLPASLLSARHMYIVETIAKKAKELEAQSPTVPH